MVLLQVLLHSPNNTDYHILAIWSDWWLWCCQIMLLNVGLCFQLWEIYILLSEPIIDLLSVPHSWCWSQSPSSRRFSLFVLVSFSYFFLNNILNDCSWSGFNLSCDQVIWWRGACELRLHLFTKGWKLLRFLIDFFQCKNGMYNLGHISCPVA